MDSGNSGSMQSSSGGDEDSISSFMMNPSSHFGSISSTQPPHLSHLPPTFLDPSTHNLDAFSHSPANPNANPLYNLDLTWSRNLRSNPNYADFGSLTGLSSSSSQSLLGAQGLSQGQYPSSSSLPLRASQQPDHQTNIVKNPKKRTRASRRAPTTVLTTDTTNFRQMVQEFTGIPAAPFTASPYSRRLDLFGSGSAIRSGHLDTLGPFYTALRPSAQEVQPLPYPSSSTSAPSFLNSSTFVDAIVPTTTTNNTINSTSNIVGASNNFQQSQNMLSMQNPNLTFQSLLRSQPNFGAKSPENSRIPSLDQLGMSRSDQNVNANLGGFSSHGSATDDGTQVRDSSNALARWRDGGGASQDGGQEHFGSFDGNNGSNPQKVQHQKGLKNVSSRAEGTVDSWICPSD